MSILRDKLEISMLGRKIQELNETSLWLTEEMEALASNDPRRIIVSEELEEAIRQRHVTESRIETLVLQMRKKEFEFSRGHSK